MTPVEATMAMPEPRKMVPMELRAADVPERMAAMGRAAARRGPAP